VEAIEAEELAQRIETFFSRRDRGLAAVYLFGSFARGTQRADSDVDVGLLFAGEPPAPSVSGPRARIEGELEAELGRPVQAVTLNTASPDLVHRVLRDGLLVHEANTSRRIQFEVLMRQRYLDLLPALRRYRRREGSVS
jgi:predicted nucleotidyltransferase